MATKKQPTEIRVIFKHYLLFIFLILNFQSFTQNKLTKVKLNTKYKNNKLIINSFFKSLLLK
jgi:hypothetical protein